ncbi:uncharacterized protein [Palaemon carinicauda]|uniref:uncharacterized protein n=1 Tax=Palaemon carinicauda TaxID=392227 RepID=UPI0035B670C7
MKDYRLAKSLRGLESLPVNLRRAVDDTSLQITSSPPTPIDAKGLGDVCVLYKTFVTAEYGGTNQDYYLYTTCYTSWFFSKNLAPRVVPSMATPNSASLAESEVIKGFFCYGHYSCSVTNVMSYPWWRGDLQMTYTVSALIVKPRDDLLDFSNVEIRFGNSPTISENPIFGTYSGTTPSPGSVLTFKPVTPMAGRYLSFQSLLTNAALGVCEVQIIEA